MISRKREARKGEEKTLIASARPSRAARKAETTSSRRRTSRTCRFRFRDFAARHQNHVGHRITGDRRGQSNSRGVGWEYVHVCIDDASRVAYAEIKKSERKASAVAFLKAAVIYYAKLGVSIQRVMTDNGSCYKSRAFSRACKRLGLKHIRTRPYTPKTNGKAERFIQTALREWAYAKAYQRSDHRGAELPIWLHRYNWHRPHGSIGAKPPISRLGLPGNNLLRLHS